MTASETHLQLDLLLDAGPTAAKLDGGLQAGDGLVISGEDLGADVVGSLSLDGKLVYVCLSFARSFYTSALVIE